jgi:hypothetical protein
MSALFLDTSVAGRFVCLLVPGMNLTDDAVELVTGGYGMYDVSILELAENYLLRCAKMTIAVL